MWQVGLRCHNDPLLLREGLYLLIIDLIAVLDTFPVHATGELSGHHGGRRVQVIA